VFTHLHEPRFEVSVDENIVAVTLEAVAVVDHDVLHAAQAVDDHLVDALEQPDPKAQRGTNTSTHW